MASVHSSWQHLPSATQVAKCFITLSLLTFQKVFSSAILMWIKVPTYQKLINYIILHLFSWFEISIDL